RVVMTLRQAVGALVERLELGRQLRHGLDAGLERLETRDDRVDVLGRLGDRLTHPREPIGRHGHRLQQLLVAVTLRLHLVQERTHLLGDFLIVGSVSEQFLQQGAHLTLLRTRRPLGLRTAGSAAWTWRGLAPWKGERRNRAGGPFARGGPCRPTFFPACSAGTWTGYRRRLRRTRGKIQAAGGLGAGPGARGPRFPPPPPSVGRRAPPRMG